MAAAGHVCRCGVCFGCLCAARAARSAEQERLRRGGLRERLEEARRLIRWRPGKRRHAALLAQGGLEAEQHPAAPPVEARSPER